MKCGKKSVGEGFYMALRENQQLAATQRKYC